MVEQRTFNPWVVGSSPTGPTRERWPEVYPITTERTLISPLVIEDLEVFLGYRKDPDVARFQGWDENYSLEQAKKLIESQRGVQFPSEGNWLQLGVRHKSTGQLLGDLALKARPKNDFEIGFTIASSHRRQGFAKEAASALVEKLFANHKARKVLAFTDERNLSSIKTLESIGFVQREAKAWQEDFKGERVTVLHFERAS